MIEFIRTEHGDDNYLFTEVCVKQDGQVVAGALVPCAEAQRLEDFYKLGVRYGHMGIGVDTKFVTEEAP